MYLAKISLHGPMTLKQLRDVFGDPYQNDCHVGATIGEGLEEVRKVTRRGRRKLVELVNDKDQMTLYAF